MIVNINPYDTGFEENSHIMRFSAVARAVQTTANSNKVSFHSGLKRQISTQFSNLKNAIHGPAKVKLSIAEPSRYHQNNVGSSNSGMQPGLPHSDQSVVTSSFAPQIADAVHNRASMTESEEWSVVEREIEVIEEDEEEEEEDERDVLVDRLFEEIRDLREQVSDKKVYMIVETCCLW